MAACRCLRRLRWSSSMWRRFRRMRCLLRWCNMQWLSCLRWLSCWRFCCWQWLRLWPALGPRAFRSPLLATCAPFPGPAKRAAALPEPGPNAGRRAGVKVCRSGPGAQSAGHVPHAMAAEDVLPELEGLSLGYATAPPRAIQWRPGRRLFKTARLSGTTSSCMNLSFAKPTAATGRRGRTVAPACTSLLRRALAFGMVWHGFKHVFERS